MTVFCSQIPEVSFCHFCQVLLLRSKSLGAAQARGRGSHEDVNTGMSGALGATLEATYLRE